MAGVFMKKLLSLLCTASLLTLPIFAADLSITAASVVASSDAVTKKGTAGATITAGQVVYLDASTNTLKLAKADALATSNAVGIALHAASANQPLRYVVYDPDFTPGVTSTEGLNLRVSSGTAGGITATVADVTTGQFPVVFGVVLDGAHWLIDFPHALKTDSALP